MKRRYFLALIPLAVCLTVALSFRLVEPDTRENRSLNDHRKARALAHYEQIWVVSGFALSGLTVFLLGVHDISRALKERRRLALLASREKAEPRQAEGGD